MSQASHEDALQAFLEAQEPIIVHVLRRSRNSSDQPLIADDNALSMSGGNRNDELNKESDRRSCICPRSVVGTQKRDHLCHECEISLFCDI